MSYFVKGIIAGNHFITETLLSGLLRTGEENPQEYCVADSNRETCAEWERKFHVRTTINPVDFVSSAAFLIFAFHHKDVDSTLKKIAPKIRKDTLIISVMHQTKIADFEEYLPDHQIIRLVLNPSVITGSGLCAYAANKNATVDAKAMAQLLIKHLGSIVEVESEEQLEQMREFIMANTFLSYLTVKSMIDAGRKLGMTPKDAAFIAEKSLNGAVETLVTNRQQGMAMLQEAFRKEIMTEAVGLIKTYGIADEVDKMIEESAAPPPPVEEEPEVYNFRYKWMSK